MLFRSVFRLEIKSLLDESTVVPAAGRAGAVRLARLAELPGEELDLLVVQGNRRIGFEIKHASAPQLSPSMRTAVNDLNNLTMQVAANAC